MNQFLSYNRLLNDIILENGKVVKIWGITIDKNLNFKSQVKHICRKVDRSKGRCIVKGTIIYWPWKKALLYKSMIRSHFTYYPLVWMFWFRRSISIINEVHGRAWILIYQHNRFFEMLLEKQQEFSYHQRTLQVLMTEIYKIVNGKVPSNNEFPYSVNLYNLRNFNIGNYGLIIVT